MFRKIALSLCFTLFLGLLTACSPDKILHLEKAKTPTNQTSENTQKNTEIGAPIALPPRFNTNEPLKPGQTETAYMPNGLPVLKPKGINADTLFSEKIKNTDERFDRVENAVVDMRKEFESLKPSIVRLAAVESDMQNLIKELEVLLQETPNPTPQPLPIQTSNNDEPRLDIGQLDLKTEPPKDNQEHKVDTSTQPKATPPPPKQAKAASPPKTHYKEHKGTVAQNLRAGEHADKVRLVIDTNKKVPFTIDLDNDEKLIIIELPDAQWVSTMKQSFPGTKLIESYNVEAINDGKGSMIIITLKKATKILAEKRLDPDAQNNAHRIYFDLAL